MKQIELYLYDCFLSFHLIYRGETIDNCGGPSVSGPSSAIPTPDSQSASASPSDSGSAPSPLQVVNYFFPFP